jgi:hypothetical protein
MNVSTGIQLRARVGTSMNAIHCMRVHLSCACICRACDSLENSLCASGGQQKCTCSIGRWSFKPLCNLSEGRLLLPTAVSSGTESALVHRWNPTAHKRHFLLPLPRSSPYVCPWRSGHRIVVQQCLPKDIRHLRAVALCQERRNACLIAEQHAQSLCCCSCISK